MKGRIGRLIKNFHDEPKKKGHENISGWRYLEWMIFFFKDRSKSQ